MEPPQQADPFAPVEAPLEPQDVPTVQLAAERLQSARLQAQNAQLHLQNRQNEFNSLVAQVQAKYQENGKYVVTGLDTDRGVVTRHLVAPGT